MKTIPPNHLDIQNKVYEFARKAGFDSDAFAYTEFSLVPFFKIVVEECAKIAELQSRVYTGEHNEDAGCLSAARAIKRFGGIDE